MQDRACVRGLVRRPPIEIVGEDGFERAVGARADVDGVRTSGLQTLATIGTGKPHDAEQVRKPCSGCERSSKINSHSAAVAGPMRAASARMRAMVHPA